MQDYKLEQSNKTSQVQTQQISMRRIMGMKLLALGSGELREKVFKEVQENPALEIIKDPLSEGFTHIKKGNISSVKTYESNKISGYHEKASDIFQKILETSKDNRNTLRDHLIFQLNTLSVEKHEYEMCKLLIDNLDSRGFYILAPESLLKNLKAPISIEQKRILLKKCIKLIRYMDPLGICCKDIYESLRLQAQLKGGASKLTFFLLNGHLEMMFPPSAEKIYKKIHKWIDEQEKMSFQTKEIEIQKRNVTYEAIENSLRFIKSLNPHPASEFECTPQINFMQPDIYIEKKHGFLEKDKPESGLITCTSNCYFKITAANNIIPEIRINNSFKDKQIQKFAAKKEFFKTHIRKAQLFTENLHFRNMVLIRSCSFLVIIQKQFFLLGQEYLAPLSRRKFAKIIGIHESTVSRMADSKFIQCNWGIFPIKYFFSRSVIKAKDGLQSPLTEISNNILKMEIVRIINETSLKHMRISDQKLTDILNNQGYKIARRTVTKYREELNIEASYKR